MSKLNKTAVLSLALAAMAALKLSTPQVKHVLSTIASAVWGS